jgi:hypothetical protein
MICLNNIDHLVIPHSLGKKITKLYTYIGKNQTFEEVVDSDLDKVIGQTIERDCYYLSLLLDLKITDNRLRLITLKDSKPRTNEEKILYRLKEALKDFQYNYQDKLLQSNDFINLTSYILDEKLNYTESYRQATSVLLSQSKMSKRKLLDDLNESYLSKTSEYEAIVLLANYLIDFYNLKPFTNGNEIVFYLVMYYLLLKNQLLSLKYVSFFEALYNTKEQLNQVLTEASINWSQGFIQSLSFIDYLVDLLLDSYQKVQIVLNIYQKDLEISKQDNLELTILNFNGIFSKDDIRQIHPFVSESTINRALKKLKDEGKIEPVGRGRSAKWAKIL